MRKIYVSSRAERLNQDDNIDFVGLARSAEASKDKMARNGIYCADVVENNIYIRTISEREKNYERKDKNE